MTLVKRLRFKPTVEEQAVLELARAAYDTFTQLPIQEYADFYTSDTTANCILRDNNRKLISGITNPTFLHFATLFRENRALQYGPVNSASGTYEPVTEADLQQYSANAFRCFVMLEKFPLGAVLITADDWKNLQQAKMPGGWELMLYHGPHCVAGHGLQQLELWA